MKKLFIVANWKSNKTKSEALQWFQELSTLNSQLLTLIGKEIIVCPPFTLLATFNETITKLQLPLKLGAQDISPFNEGPYTGEVNGRQIKEFADYVLVGHSERRRYFGEDEKMINKKLEMATKNGLTPILCISSIEQILNSQFPASPAGGSILNLVVAYEPVFAIGTGNPDTPKNADNIARVIKEKNDVASVLYGGSVTAENVKSFTTMPSIDGVLVGTASLDSHEFLQIITNS